MDKSQIYTHIEKGGKYKIILSTSIKIEGAWIPGVVYVGEAMRDNADPESFTRSVKSFKENFILEPFDAQMKPVPTDRKFKTRD